MEQLNVTVYKTDTQIIITGQPDADDLKHHCDQMGCGREHVLYRFSIPSSKQEEAFPYEMCMDSLSPSPG